MVNSSVAWSGLSKLSIHTGCFAKHLSKVLPLFATEKLPLRCPSTKLWLALARLETYENARKVLNKVRKHILTDHQIWLCAGRLEGMRHEKDMFDSIVHSSAELWLALARLETYENARKVLNKVRKHILTDPQIWLCAGRLEGMRYEKDMVDRAEEVLKMCLCGLCATSKNIENISNTLPTLRAFGW
ncbi:Pre-mRNA-processing factor 6 [Parelaphostrongylus tenuis]|uniref:Pre-mRNA-processing factor 6 n=1 Tax=Parelaphostrongylus tenuis TaxID=148309 RepID=A0AAD5M0A3_PARTN|nr:Pre-mRNA-processing factor 6 [Parelaphostrongylus tenuis]